MYAAVCLFAAVAAHHSVGAGGASRTMPTPVHYQWNFQNMDTVYHHLAHERWSTCHRSYRYLPRLSQRFRHDRRRDFSSRVMKKNSGRAGLKFYADIAMLPTESNKILVMKYASHYFSCIQR